MATPMNTILGKGKKQKVDSVNIRKAANGYTVSCWGDKGEVSMIAADLDEAMGCAREMFGDKKKDKD